MNRTERMRKFRFEAIESITTYVLVNAFLVLLNWITSPYYWWVIWVIAGWGLGLVIGLVSRYFRCKLDIN